MMPQGKSVEIDPKSQELLRRWQESGDSDALDELLRVEVSALKDLIASRGRDLMSSSASASDIAQEAVLRLLGLETPPRFADPRALRGYLWVTAWRLLLQRIRRPYRRKQPFDPADSASLPPELVTPASTAPEDREAASALEFAMNLLPDADRSLLDRAYFQDQKLADIARDLHVSESAVKMRLLRARRALAARLASWRDVIG